jgi:hypothetical protein
MKQRRNLLFSEDGRTSQLGLKAVQSAPENTIRARRGHPARTCMGACAPSRENHRAVSTVEGLRGAGLAVQMQVLEAAATAIALIKS